MQFALTDEQMMIADTARAFFAENATSNRTRRAMESDGIDRDLWSRLCTDLGLGGVTVPAVLGGAGLGMVEMATVAEAAGAQVAALPLLGLVMASVGIAAGGDSAQQAEWFPKLAAGTAIAAYGESDAITASGSTLTGYVPFVPHGGIADMFLIAAGTTAWIVRTDAPGLVIERPVTMDQTRPLAHLTLVDTPADPLLDGPAAIAAAHAGGLVCLSAEALGGAQAALDRTVAYAKERIQFGRSIGSFQAYKHRLADMMVDIEQARSAVYWAACAIDESSPEAMLALHSAKSFAADTYCRCAGDMIQLHGGIGFTWEHDAHLFFKRARAIHTMLGDSDWHREQIAQIIGLGEAA